MPSWKKSFGTYLKTEDLAGAAVRVVIERITEEELGGEGKKETKLVAHFYGKDKALVLNKTKCEALELISGTDETEAWVGLQIVLAPGRTKYQGKTVGCIDIKPGGPAGPGRGGNGAARRATPPVELPPEEDGDEEVIAIDSSDIPF